MGLSVLLDFGLPTGDHLALSASWRVLPESSLAGWPACVEAKRPRAARGLNMIELTTKDI